MNEPLFMFRFPSHPRNVEKVSALVERVAMKYKISPDVYGNLLISMTEAVTNAIKHGNHNDESKMVKIRLAKRKNMLSVSISDEGLGFDYHSLPDPTKPENLMKIGGRGVFLMTQLSDTIEFFDNGSTVEMGFNIR